jgi:hypothetical protein
MVRLAAGPYHGGLSCHWDDLAVVLVAAGCEGGRDHKVSLTGAELFAL